MNDRLIAEIMTKAKEHFGRKDLAEKLGLTANQVTDISAGRAALPFVAALKLAELLEVEPLPLLCANEVLMEKNAEKKAFLKSFFQNNQMSHNLRYRLPITTLKSKWTDDHRNLSARQLKQKKPVWQGANEDRILPYCDPRKWPRYSGDELLNKSTWALRPIPSFPGLVRPEPELRTRENWKARKAKTT